MSRHPIADADDKPGNPVPTAGVYGVGPGQSDHPETCVVAESVPKPLGRVVTVLGISGRGCSIERG